MAACDLDACETFCKISSQHCVYCGSPWDIHRDHVIPSSYLREKRKFENDWLVPACAECNQTLSDILICNVPERAAYVAGKYKSKYLKLINFPTWSDNELSGIADHLRKSIEAREFNRSELLKRLDHLGMISRMPVDYLSELSNDTLQLEDPFVIRERERRSAALERERFLHRAKLTKQMMKRFSRIGLTDLPKIS